MVGRRTCGCCARAASSRSPRLLTPCRSTPSCCRLRVQGAGCRVQGAGCRVQGAGFRVQGSGFRVHARCIVSLSEAPDAVQVHLTHICPSHTDCSITHTSVHPTQISSHQPFKYFQKWTLRLEFVGIVGKILDFPTLACAACVLPPFALRGP